MTERTKYSPTVNPADERLRGRYVGIRTPCNENPSVDLLEHTVVLRQDGTEREIQEGPGLSFPIPVKEYLSGDLVAKEFLERVIDRVDYVTGEPLGQTITILQAVNDFYSVLRHMQLQRDAKQEAKP